MKASEANSLTLQKILMCRDAVLSRIYTSVKTRALEGVFQLNYSFDSELDSVENEVIADLRANDYVVRQDMQNGRVFTISWENCE